MSLLKDVNSAMDQIPIFIRWPLLFLAAIGLINAVPGLLKVTWVVGLAFFLLWIFGKIGDDTYNIGKQKFKEAMETASTKIAERIAESHNQGGAA